MSKGFKRVKRIMAALLALALLCVGAAAFSDSAGAKVMYCISGTPAVFQRSKQSSYEELVTWNRIDSESDYREFITLMQRAEGVPVLFVFTDKITGKKYTIGGNKIDATTETIPIDFDWKFEGSYSDSTTRRPDLYATTADYSSSYSYQEQSPVKSFGDIDDDGGFALIGSGADHVVSYGNIGSFTAKEDTSTDDSEDFYLRMNNDSSYLVCREGYPLFYWQERSLATDSYIAAWLYPKLEAGNSASLKGKNENATFSYDVTCYGFSYLPKEVSLSVRGTWKLGNWAQSLGSTERKWDTWYVYQETRGAEVLKSNGEYMTMDQAGMLNDHYPYQYAYAVLCAQSNSGLNLFAATEWLSKKEIGYFTDSGYLKNYNDRTWDNRVIGGMYGTTGAEIVEERKERNYDGKINTTIDFEVYYAVEGISLSAMYGEEAYPANANVIASDDNVAKLYKKYGESVVESPSGSDETALLNSIYTVSKNEVVVIPPQSTLTIEKGATLVVSKGGVLVLNGGIINHGLIIVQNGGMILRYNGGPNCTGNVINGRSSKDEAWYGDSTIICDGGDMIVRKNGRVRVNNLGIGVMIGTSSAAESKNGSTLLNYGYIETANLVCNDVASCVIDGGCLAVGREYSRDLLLTTSIDSLLGSNLTYAGACGTVRNLTLKNGGTTNAQFE